MISFILVKRISIILIALHNFLCSFDCTVNRHEILFSMCIGSIAVCHMQNNPQIESKVTVSRFVCNLLANFLCLFSYYPWHSWKHWHESAHHFHNQRNDRLLLSVSHSSILHVLPGLFSQFLRHIYTSFSFDRISSKIGVKSMSLIAPYWLIKYLLK